MKKLLIPVTGIVLMSVFFSRGSAQKIPASELSLEDLYKNEIFQPKEINEVRWMISGG